MVTSSGMAGDRRRDPRRTLQRVHVWLRPACRREVLGRRRRGPTRDLLALANDDEVADLVAMRDLARTDLPPALPAAPAITGMTFDGSADLNADADLIIAEVVNIQANQGGKPRANGTRACVLARADLDQLLGYTLMDYSDTFKLHTVAVYAARFGHYTPWSIQDLTDQLAGHPLTLRRCDVSSLTCCASTFPHTRPPAAEDDRPGSTCHDHNPRREQPPCTSPSLQSAPSPARASPCSSRGASTATGQALSDSPPSP